MTTNNDPPQTFGGGARHDATFDPRWHDRIDEAAWADAEVRESPAASMETDEAEEANEAEPYTSPGPGPYSSAHPQGSGPFRQPDYPAFPAVNGWPGWGEQAEPGAGDDGYPQSSPGSPEPEHLEEPGYPQARGYPQTPGYPEGVGYPVGSGYPEGLGYPQPPEYPQGPGYAPVPWDQAGPEEPGYPAGPGYAPDPGYPQDLHYPQDPWGGLASGSVPDPSHDQGRSYAQDAEAIPAMEPLPGALGVLAPAQRGRSGRWAQRDERARPDQVPPGMNPAAGAAGRVPRQRVAPGLTPQPLANPDYERETSDSLTAESLLPGKRQALGSGWRRSIDRLTGGLFRLGESAAEVRRRDLINRVRTPVAGGHHRVAVLSLKGGVGKTTTAVGLGATLATLRGDRVIAVDANPDRGTLSDKVRLETAATVRDLLNERNQIRRYADVRAFTSQAPSRLEVLASDRDPGVSVAFGADDYCDAAQVLEHFYSICLTDCGTGLLHSAMSGVLRLADQIVVVSSPSVDGARSASATLDWLDAHNCADLVRNGVVVLSTIRPKSKSSVDLNRLEHHFASRCRAVTRIPYDPHLEEGAEVELELLDVDTADAYLTLAAIVGDGLAWPRRLLYRSALP